MLNMDWPDHRKQIAEEIKALDLPIFIWGGVKQSKGSGGLFA